MAGRMLPVGVVLGLVVSLALSDQSRANAGVGTWQGTGSQLGAHYNEHAATLANGRVLVVYSENEEATPAHPVFTEGLASELYEPDSGMWLPGPRPPVRNASTIVPLADNGALLLGEASCSSSSYMCLPTAATYRLDPGNSSWAPSAPMLQPRGRPTVVRLADGRVLVAGGFGDSCTPTFAFGYSCASLASVEIFDPATGAWSPAAPLPEPRGGASATLLSDGSVLLVGGSKQTSDALRYEPESNRWQTLGPAPFTGTQLFALPGDRAIAIGSEPEADFYGSLGTAASRAILICESIAAETYTAARDTWTAAPPLPGEPIACSTQAAQLADGQILYSAAGSRYVLDRHQRCWTPTGAPATAEHYGFLAALPDGHALDFGGTVADNGPFTGAEIYTPGPQTCTIAQQTQTRIFTHLAPHGRAARVATVLKAGYTFSLHAPRPGRLRVDWYFRRTESEGRPGPVLVAAGRAVTTRGGRLELTVRVIPAERELLERPLQFQLTAKATFLARSGQVVTATRGFTLNGS